MVISVQRFDYSRPPKRPVGPQLPKHQVHQTTSGLPFEVARKWNAKPRGLGKDGKQPAFGPSPTILTQESIGSWLPTFDKLSAPVRPRQDSENAGIVAVQQIWLLYNVA